jgi:hypothetical protein
MTAALTDLRTVVASGVLASVVLVATISLGTPYAVAFGSGSSMEPALCDGSVAIVDERLEPDVGDIVAFDRMSGSRVLHRVVATTDEHVVTMGDNRSRLDLLDVRGTSRTADIAAGDGPSRTRRAYPHHEDVVGVVVAVLSDGCAR